MAPEDMSGRFDLFGLIISYGAVSSPLLFAMAFLIGMVFQRNRLIGAMLYVCLSLFVTLVVMSEVSDIQPFKPLSFSFRALAIVSASGLPLAAFGYFIARLAHSRRRAASVSVAEREGPHD